MCYGLDNNPHPPPPRSQVLVGHREQKTILSPRSVKPQLQSSLPVNLSYRIQINLVE
jgi:hypothetical protein